MKLHLCRKIKNYEILQNVIFNKLFRDFTKINQTLNLCLLLKPASFNPVTLSAYGSATVTKQLTIESGYHFVGLAGFGISGSNAITTNSIYIDYSTNIAYMTIYNGSSISVNAQPWASFFASKV